MPPTTSYLRSVLTLAVLLMVAVFMWRVSGVVIILLHDFHVHLVASMPKPKVAAPKLNPMLPKLTQISCRP